MNIRNSIIVCGALILVGLGAWAGFLFVQYLRPSPGSGSGSGQNQNQNPFGTPATTSTPTNVTGSTGALPLSTTAGAVVYSKDFTIGVTPIPTGLPIGNVYDIVNSNTGSPYGIQFTPADSSFQIILEAEPLGATRLKAENALRSMTGLSNTVLCTLHVSVTTTADINPQLAGEEFGLSFCPNAVSLP